MRCFQGGCRAGAKLGLMASIFNPLGCTKVLARMGAAGNMAAILIANTWFDDSRQHVRLGFANSPTRQMCSNSTDMINLLEAPGG